MARPESDDVSWKDGRLVLRRPEIRDSQVARMNVPLTRERRRMLSRIVHQIIKEEAKEARREEGRASRSRDTRP